MCFHAFCLEDDTHFRHLGTRLSASQKETTGPILTRSSSSQKSTPRTLRGRIGSSQSAFAKSGCLNSTPLSSLQKAGTMLAAGTCVYAALVAAVG